MKQKLWLIPSVLALLSLANFSFPTSRVRSQETCSADKRIDAVTFSPDSQNVLADWTAGSARIWSSQTGEAIHTFVHEPDFSASSVSFSPDSKYILVGSAHEATVWDRQTGEKIHVFSSPFSGEPYGTQAIFLPNGRYILTSGGVGATL